MRYQIEVHDDCLVYCGPPIPVRDFLAIAKLGELLGFTQIGPTLEGEGSNARLVLVRKEDGDDE